jgi:predicted phage terminase large subunit-like protein
MAVAPGIDAPSLSEWREILAQRSLAAFCERTTPWKLEPWQRLICARLERLRHETGQRVLIHGPPQHGKSLLVSQRFPCWVVGHDPKHRVRLACYNETHATRFSAVNLELLHSEEYAQIFPDEACRVPDVGREREWSTLARQQDRDAQPSFRALGLGSGFSGLGVDLLLVDDPYKSQEEAYSDIVNEGIWAWWRSTVISRLNPDTNIVVMFHRWRENDLAGRLLEQGGWESMRFPAIADGKPDDPSGRKKGEALSPRYPVEYLEEVRRTQGDLYFVALYQGAPAPDEGNLFKSNWFLTCEEEDVPAKGRRVRGWDLAATPGGGDFTCGGRMLRDREGRYWAEDVVHGQWDVGERDRQIWLTAERDGPEVEIWLEEEPGSAGKSQTQALVRKLEGFHVRAERPTGEKGVRARPLASQMSAGNVRFVKGPWYEFVKNCMLAFPAGKYDDPVDMWSLCFNKLARAQEFFAI